MNNDQRNPGATHERQAEKHPSSGQSNQNEKRAQPDKFSQDRERDLNKKGSDQSGPMKR